MPKKRAVATFEFEDEGLMSLFLGYMSYGGGEWGFMKAVKMFWERKQTHPNLGIDNRVHSDGVDFDYHSANGKKFGPVVRVTWTPMEDEMTALAMAIRSGDWRK